LRERDREIAWGKRESMRGVSFKLKNSFFFGLATSREKGGDSRLLISLSKILDNVNPLFLKYKIPRGNSKHLMVKFFSK